MRQMFGNIAIRNDDSSSMRATQDSDTTPMMVP